LIKVAYESYKFTQTTSSTSSPKDSFMYAKKKQVDYLYGMAMDREENCSIEGRNFKKSPRIFDRRTKANYFQTVTVETIESDDRFDAGNIMFYDGDYWICTSKTNFHNLYCKGSFVRTNYSLKWQKSDGSIIERRCWVQSAAQYNSGENENKTITLGSDQIMIVLPSDDETNILDSPRRFFIDKNLQSPTPYKITRNDTIPYSDWDYGCVNLIVTQDVIGKSDNIGLLICDYKEPTTLPSPTDPDENGNQSPILLQATFTCKGNKIIKAGGSAKTFSVSFSGENQVPVTDVDYIWSVSITKEFKNLLTVETLSNGQCKVKLGYDDLIVGNYVRLSVVNSEGTEIGYELIEIGGNL